MSGVFVMVFVRFAPAVLLVCTFPVFASTYVVNDLGDGVDVTPGDNLCATAAPVCTLRAAIAEANAHAGADVITFSVAGTITPSTAYPTVVDRLTIEGTSSPGYTTEPVVIVHGASAVAVGFFFASGAPSSRVSGLKIHGFTNTALLIENAGMIVERNYLGPVNGGTPNGIGLRLAFLSSGALIGGNTDGQGNVISGNASHGISIEFGSSHTIADNFIGVTPAGTAALPNGGNGINASSTTSLMVGGTSPGTWNVISGNGQTGAVIFGSSNTVAGNIIGMDATGTATVGNGRLGVSVLGGTGNRIGTPTARNVVSGNHVGGIDAGSGTVTINNIVGLNGAGTTAAPNLGDGISGSGTIGTPQAGNVISANRGNGIRATSAAVIQNNIIGLDPTGTIDFGNDNDGIHTNGLGVIIGGTGPNEGNTISGNGNGGIRQTGGSGLRIYGNAIGLTADRTAARPNLGNGVSVSLFAFDVQIGSSGPGANVISGNAGNGVVITDTSQVVIEGNRIGSVGLGNEQSGVVLVGSPAAIRDNLVAGNHASGVVVVTGSPSPIRANSIFANGLLGIDLGNDGVTANDPQDPDTGPNGRQNFPVITASVTAALESLIRGSLNSTPNTAFTLEFFSSAGADPSGFGEGQQFLGQTDVTTDGGGNATFDWNGPPLTAGHAVTATATGPNGTSEFSAVYEITSAPAIHFSTTGYPTTENSGSVIVTVVREGDLSVTSSVDFATSPDTAAAGADYTPISGSLIFNPTENTKTFAVAILQDPADEPEERFLVTLSNPVMASVGTPSSAEVTIADDDALPLISITDVARDEGNSGTTTFMFVVTLTNPSASTVSVNFATGDQTALAPSDYAPASGTLVFASGVVTQQISITVTGDQTGEGDETFVVNLTNAVNAAIEDSQGLGTIVNDDAAVKAVPTLSNWALLGLLMILATVAMTKLG